MPQGKATTRTNAPARKTDRRWRVPPPLTHGPEPLEGGTILEELGEPLGVVLWQAARDVSLWTATQHAERRELFAADAQRLRRQAITETGVDGELARGLRDVSAVLGGEADGSVVARACETISQWADGAGLYGIALAYAQAVALIRDTDAAIAYEVALLAQRRGEDARAETWFRRAIMLARQSGDWSVYSRSFVSLGDLYIERESYTIARKLHVRASRAAHRHSLHAIEEQAVRGLSVITEKTGAAAADHESSPKGLPPKRSARARR